MAVISHILALGSGVSWVNLFAAFLGTGGGFGAFWAYRKTVRVKELDVQAEAARLYEVDKARTAQMSAAELTRLWDAYKAQEQEIGGLKQEMLDLRKHRHDLANEAHRVKLENALLKKEVEILQDQVKELQKRLDEALLELAVERERGGKRDRHDAKPPHEPDPAQ